MALRSSRLFILQCLVLLCSGAPAAIAGLWEGLSFCLPFWLSAGSDLSQSAWNGSLLQQAFCDQSSDFWDCCGWGYPLPVLQPLWGCWVNRDGRVVRQLWSRCITSASCMVPGKL